MVQDPKDIIEGEVLGVQARQHELEQLQSALSGNEQFTRFMELSKSVKEKTEEIRARIESVMIPAYKAGKVGKSLKGDWGSVTVTERDDFTIDEAELSSKFFIKTPDTNKIRKTYQLEGKAPNGCTPSKKYGIMMKLK